MTGTSGTRRGTKTNKTKTALNTKKMSNTELMKTGVNSGTRQR